MAYHMLLPHLAEIMTSFVKEFSFLTTLPGTVDDLVLISLFGNTSFSSAAVIFSMGVLPEEHIAGWVWMWCV